MQKQFLNPPNLPNWQEVFSQLVIVKTNGVRTIYVAGQVAVDEQKHLIGAGDLRAQSQQAFANLARALTAGGASTAEVVKLNIYIKHYQPTDAAIIREAFRKVFPHPDLPTSTWLGVEALAEEGFLIEVDAVAMVEVREVDE
jgi:enamine deaminase RidA (YjgF/YER057c/UK114 family)